MDSVNIRGGIALQGQVGIQGSKNAVLPVLAATLLAEGTSVIQNCPRLADVYHMQTLLKSLGCSVTREKDRLKVNTDGMNGPRALSRDIPKEAVESMRSSIVLLGALVNRTGEVELAYPGGCVIGERPIDIHIEALKQLHVTFEEKSYGLHACTEGLKGAEIRLPFPSVGATENVLLAAAGADGTTILRGAAREPEIEVLCGFLNACGADITGGGSSTILIRGKRKLRGEDSGGNLSLRLPGGGRRGAADGSAREADGSGEEGREGHGRPLAGNGQGPLYTAGRNPQISGQAGNGPLSRISHGYAVFVSAGAGAGGRQLSGGREDF